MKNNNSANWQLIRKQYFQSEDWAWVRRQVIRRDRQCMKCKTKYSKKLAFEIHHTDYAFFGSADINEVESCCLLCRKCHRFVHGLPPEYSVFDAEKLLGEW